MKRIGFKCSWMNDEDVQVKDSQQRVPTIVDDLKDRIADTTVYMATDEFAALPVEQRAKVIMSYNLDVQLEYKLSNEYK